MNKLVLLCGVFLSCSTAFATSEALSGGPVQRDLSCQAENQTEKLNPSVQYDLKLTTQGLSVWSCTLVKTNLVLHGRPSYAPLKQKGEQDDYNVTFVGNENEGEEWGDNVTVDLNKENFTAKITLKSGAVYNCK